MSPPRTATAVVILAAAQVGAAMLTHGEVGHRATSSSAAKCNLACSVGISSGHRRCCLTADEDETPGLNDGTGLAEACWEWTGSGCWR
jgi:hypothetical protein